MLLGTLGKGGANPRKHGSNKEASSQACLEIPREPPSALGCKCTGRQQGANRKQQLERRQGRAEIRPLLVAGKAEFGGGAPTRLAGEEGQTRHPGLPPKPQKGRALRVETASQNYHADPSRPSLPTCQTTVRVIVHCFNTLQRR